jgi:hypothetical protein
MRQLAAFFVLIPALLLFGLAYRGYAGAVGVASERSGGDFDRYAARTSDGFSVEGAEQQAHLVLAGFEGLAGLGFLYVAMSLVCSTPRRQNTPLARGIQKELPYAQRRVEAAPAAPREEPAARRRTAPQGLFASGRERIEVLRRARNRRRLVENR